jgi:hypothetical protein
VGDVVEVEFFGCFEALVDEIDISVAVISVHRVVEITG